MSTPNKEKWEEEFDKLAEQGFFDNRYTKTANFSRTKIYIRDLLASQKKDIVEKLKGMQREVCGCDEDPNGFGYHTKECDFTSYGWNAALGAVITSLTEKGDE